MHLNVNFSFIANKHYYHHQTPSDLKIQLIKYGLLQGGSAGPQNFGWVGCNAFGPTNIGPYVRQFSGKLVNWSNQMSEFKVKMHQIRFSTTLRNHSAPQTPSCI